MESKTLLLSPKKIKPSTIVLPGSKSITNRSLLLAALAQNHCHLHNVLLSDDTQHMINALSLLGIELKNSKPSEIMIKGQNGVFPNQQTGIFLGNAGTAFRPLTAVLSLQKGTYFLYGVPRMHERPIGDLVDALQQIGSNIQYQERTGYPPLLIQPFQDNGTQRIQVNGHVSSQFLTALLIALPLLKKEITIEMTSELISKPYIQITLNMLKKFGVKIIHHDFKKFIIPANSQYNSPSHYMIEGDASSASYFFAISFLTGVPLTIEGIGKNSIQGDIIFAKELKKLGANLKMLDHSIMISRNMDNPIPAFNINANNIPDAAMAFCIIALAAKGTSTIYNIASWRVKETDRITAMSKELTKLGAKIATTQESISITPPEQLKQNVKINTYDDHRMAMCFALLSVLNCSVIIENPECVNKTFPDFFQVLSSISTI